MMTEDANVENFLRELPDRKEAAKFYESLKEKHPSTNKLLLKDTALLSDVLTLASFSPLLGTTLLQNPSYLNWIKRQRSESYSREKEDLLESLARFALTNSEIEPQILLARFRRRELLRIYLRDIRHLGTIAEITRDLSSLADAVLEYALRIAAQEQQNRFGVPQEVDEKGRSKPAKFCIVSLGKLGSEELNYSSDIDLLFLYSAEGETSGSGTRGVITNREYFTKVAENVSKIVGDISGEGAAYRVDLRLRPYGRVGALAVSLDEAIKYYSETAQLWERQTMIRARASAGETEIFKKFYQNISEKIYSSHETVESALKHIKQSKDKINHEHQTAEGFNVKLGHGGIREIEFIAQALQIAYGAKDVWLRASHTLKSLSRLADRALISDTELTNLSNAYDFLRRLEHHLQMEHGLQTHILPLATERRSLIARKMFFSNTAEFEKALAYHTANVSMVFNRVFGEIEKNLDIPEPQEKNIEELLPNQQTEFDKREKGVSHSAAFERILLSIEKSETKIRIPKQKFKLIEKFCAVSPYFSEVIASNPQLANDFPDFKDDFELPDYSEIFKNSIFSKNNFAKKISVLRCDWSKFLLEIAVFDVFEKFGWHISKEYQTSLAEAAIKNAIFITKEELKSNFNFTGELKLAVLAFGKLGGGGMDYGSDLDLTLVYDESDQSYGDLSEQEFYKKAAEIFIAVLSNFTRDGNLYRVDLRLRPDGKNGAMALGKSAFLNYLENRSSIWEWLAYVKIRGVFGENNLAGEIEKAARTIIHQKALKADADELRNESLKIRNLLEKEKTKNLRETDIKFGAGGMLDVYFAVRYLQLKKSIPDSLENRSTFYTLDNLKKASAISENNFQTMNAGYAFLSELDHNLRLTVGRSNTIPQAKKDVLEIIASRMKLDSTEKLFENLHLHRLHIRETFEDIFNNN